MKKALLLILILQCSITYSQEFSMTDQGNKWGIRWYDEQCGNDPDPSADCEETGVYSVSINGETTIDNITYVILGDRLIRQEDDIVYQYSENTGETILYDFTLEVGDTIPIADDSSCFTDQNNNNLADVIDVSIQFIAGYDRKVITFDLEYGSNLSDNIQWIEGIGAVNDPTDPNFFFCDLVIVLDCFNNGNEIFSFSSGNTDCDTLLNTSDNVKTTSLLVPNPITDQSKLTVNTFQNNTVIVFYNTLGQRIREGVLSSTTMNINRSDFPSNGIYFYQIQQKGEIVETHKFIVK